MADEEPSTKRCGKCKADKPRSEYHRDKGKRDGLAARCKECAKAIAGAWYRENIERGRESRLRWHAENRAHHLDLMRKRRASDPEAARARNREWARLNPDKKRALDKAWQAANIEKVRVYRRVSEGRRRAVAGEKIPAAVLQEIGDAQRWRCAICHCSIRKRPTTDHIVALSRGGKHERRNLQLACRPCNSAKNAKDPIDFMRSRGLLL